MNTQYMRLMQEPAMMDALINSSVSVEDANLRSREYAKMFARNALSSQVGYISLDATFVMYSTNGSVTLGASELGVPK